jgi:hypothetical protein
VIKELQRYLYVLAGTASIIRKVDKEYWKKQKAVLPPVADDGKIYY